MEKQVIRAGVPETGGPFNLCVRHGNRIYIAGLPPFEEDFCRQLRDARASGAPLPVYTRRPIEVETHVVMKHIKLLMEAAGSNMDCLLKVVVWLRDQKEQAAFDKVYRSYFSSEEVLPTRTRIQAGATPFDCGLEVDVIGYVPEK